VQAGPRRPAAAVVRPRRAETAGPRPRSVAEESPGRAARAAEPRPSAVNPAPGQVRAQPRRTAEFPARKRTAARAHPSSVSPPAEAAASATRRHPVVRCRLRGCWALSGSSSGGAARGGDDPSAKQRASLRRGCPARHRRRSRGQCAEQRAWRRREREVGGSFHPHRLPHGIGERHRPTLAIRLLESRGGKRGGERRHRGS
jgi:hypothetical protein